MLIFAHRGASGNHPENTLKAINAAVEMGVDGIEIDVHLVDDTLVVIHDRWLHRTTSGSGQLKDYSLAELSELDAGEGEAIPTLWQVLECIDANVLVNIELKGKNTAEKTVETINKSIQELGYSVDDFLVSSFDHHLLREVRTLNSQLKIGALTSNIPINYAQFAEQIGSYSIHLDINFINKTFVDDAHNRGLHVFVFTVDEKQDIEELHRLGVDGIFSNYPSESQVIIAHQQHSAKL